MLRQLRDSGTLEEKREGKLTPKRRFHAGHQPNGRQRLSAESEEVVIPAYRTAQNLFPDSG